MVAAGVGAAMNGMRPVVDLNFMDFAFGAMDEIVNQAAKARYLWGKPVPLVIRASSGVALYAAQHNNSLEAWFMHTPGLVVVMPSNPADTKGIIKSALRGEDPVMFFMHKRLTGTRGEVGGPDDLVPIGKAAVARRGTPRDADLVRDRRAEDAQGRLGAGCRGHRGRGHRSANDQPAGHRPHRRLGAQDGPRDRRDGRAALRERRLGDRRRRSRKRSSTTSTPRWPASRPPMRRSRTRRN